MRFGRAWGTVLVLAAVLPAAGCGWFAGEPKPEDTARAFLTALAGGDAAGAARLTDHPDDATALIDSVRAVLEPSAVKAELDQVRDSGGDTASASYTATWTLGEGRDWTFPATFDLRRTDDPDRPWSVRWSPAVLHPKLSAQQTIEVREQPTEPAPVTDRDGEPLLSPQKVVAVLLYKEQTAEQGGELGAVAAGLAGPLARFDAAITQQSVIDGATAAQPGNAYTVAVLREADYLEIKDLIYELPGVRFSAQTRVLPPDREFAKTLLPQIREAAEPTITGTAGWQVVTLDSAGAVVDTLHDVPPAPGTTVTTTLSRLTQSAAEIAVDALPQQAMIVALQPSTGEVLAVAQNAAADAAGLLALTGRYPPGSTFKIATASAALQAGVVTAATPVPCPGTTVIDGRSVPNSDRFDLGTVELHTAFARSCNTTFARLAADLPPAALTDAARQLGLGVDFVMAGATTVTGSAPPGDSVVARAEAGFGQGTVVASPFGLAVMAATVAGGAVRPPVLLRGTPTTADVTPSPVPQPVLDALRPMMREVVTAGTARALAPLPGEVAGKTGTAQYGDGSRSHGWFVGYRGDLAFAVLVVDGNSSTPAVDAAVRFLSIAP
ncbi:MAG TPA: penicillin-binding transpeptidase domain-containing protein [Pseudonocardiaceae bacterium]